MMGRSKHFSPFDIEMLRDVQRCSPTMDFLFWLRDLRQRGNAVEVPCYVRIVNGTVVFGHFQGGVSQQPLEHERIATTVNQELAGKGMAIKVGACFLHATRAVIMGDGKAQAIPCQHISELITKEIGSRNPTPQAHVFFENAHHNTTQRNDLYFTIFVVAQGDLSCFQVHISILDVADCGSSTARV